MKALLHFALIASIITSSVATHAAEMCGSVFFESIPYQQMALDAALKKAITANGTVKGLSSKDLELVVENIFDKQDGQKYQISHYWKKSAEQRTIDVLMRQTGEEIIHNGLLRYFEEHGLIADRSLLMTKLSIINRSSAFNMAQAAWIAFSVPIRHTIPVTMPEIFFKMKEADGVTLLLKGLDSVEGREVVKRYGLKQEAIRGYTLAGRYYTRIAIAVFSVILFEKIKDHLEKQRAVESEQAFDYLVQQFEKMFGSGKIESKEDILFENVIANFKKKYQRLPDEQERNMICLKVYGQGCPQ